MKKIFSVLSVVLATCSLVFYLSSCKDKENDPPGVTFDSTPPYIYDDTTITHGQIFTIYVQAAEETVNALIESGNISVSWNGGPDSVIQAMNFVTVQFNEPYSYVAGPAGSTEKFVFTFYTQTGLVGADSLVLNYN
jgi:hypothetical protein